MSQVSLDNVAQTSAPTVNHEDTDEIFEVESMPYVQGDSEADPEDELVKSVGDETRPIREESEPARHEQVVNKETLVDKPQ